MVALGRNIYCFTAYSDDVFPTVIERGCIEDWFISEHYGHYLLACEGDNCNSPQAEHFSCVYFNGFISKYEQHKRTMRCKGRSPLPGCYSAVEGKIADLSCNAQQSLFDFKMMNRENSSAQLCYTENCNGLGGEW